MFEKTVENESANQCIAIFHSNFNSVFIAIPGSHSTIGISQ